MNRNNVALIFMLVALCGCSPKTAENPIPPKPAPKEAPIPAKIETPKAEKTDPPRDIYLDTLNPLKAAVKMPFKITAYDAKFPLRITDIDFGNKSKMVRLERTIVSKISRVIQNFRDKYGGDLPDSLVSYQDCYVNTIRLQDRHLTVYLILLHFPTGYLFSHVLFYDGTEDHFISQWYEFNLHPLYDWNGKKLTPSNLKTLFEIKVPEIELLDFDKDGSKDFKFTRLYHNGTANHLETRILTIRDGLIETLDYQEQQLGE